MHNPCFYLLLSFHYSVSFFLLKLTTGASAFSLNSMPKRKRTASMKDTKSGETTSPFQVTTAPEARSLTDGATLANGVILPWVGYGTYKLGKERARECTLEALRRGYRCIDTAFIYAGETTERNVGLALQDAISKKILKRENVFIITKHWRAYHGYDLTNECLSKSLKRLQVDSIDLWLMHWPGPAWNTMNRRNDVIAEKGPWAYAKQSEEEMPHFRAETWRAMEDAVVAGTVKAIGVSNFTIKHLERLKETATMWPPAVNQVEFHPLYPQEELLEYCAKEGIIVQAYASLGGQGMFLWL
jgi:diketogulonate reductase-like aldo/keto reductase